MLNTPIVGAGTNPSLSMDSNSTEQSMGRLTSFQTGSQDHNFSAPQPPKVTTTDITARIQ